MLPAIRRFKIMKLLDGSHTCPIQLTNQTKNKIKYREFSLYRSDGWRFYNRDVDELNDLDSVISYFDGARDSHRLWISIAERFSRVSSTHAIQLRQKSWI